MPFRLQKPARPVEITLDGAMVLAEEGEPIAHALLASGVSALARSPKFHRPRGPSCLRGACDGCLMRVDGVPNVMTCLAPAKEGTAASAQNTLGSRKTDFLRMTDWFFPQGINHHELFAGVPGVQGVMQAFARRVAGLGRLPEEEASLATLQRAAGRQARRRTVEVLVIGAGPAGLATAAAFAARGRQVEIIDDALVPGGNLAALGGASALDPDWAELDRIAGSMRAMVQSRAVAGAVFPDGVLVVGEKETAIIEARALVLAPGAHDGVLAFEGNDLPGVMSARAGLKLLSAGIGIGEKVVVAVAPGGGPFGVLFAREVERLGAPIEVTVVDAVPIEARGSSNVKSVVFDGASHKCDALLVDAPRAPSYELPAQAGAELEHAPAGFFVRVGVGGRIREGVYAVGEVTGTPLEATRILEAAKAVVASAG